jgi:enolase
VFLCSKQATGVENWRKQLWLTVGIGDKVRFVGDELFVTIVKFLQKGIDTGAANSILVKVNQIGSLSETLDAVGLAQTNKCSAGKFYSQRYCYVEPGCPLGPR